MTDNWKNLTDAYNEYISRYPEEGIGLFGNELPLRDSVIAESGNFASNNVGKLEAEYQMQLNDELPDITDLTIAELSNLAIPLTYTLQAQITPDNLDYWKLTYKVVEKKHSNMSVISFEEWYSLRSLFHLALSDPVSNTKNSHATEVLQNTSHIAAFMAYPSLEMLIKNQIEAVGSDGIVLDSDTVWRHSDGEYYQEGDRCNSLTDLLVHFENDIANDILLDNLQEMRSKIANFGDATESNAYGLLYQWRCKLLHGESFSDVQHGIIINIICMILWDDLNSMR